MSEIKKWNDLKEWLAEDPTSDSYFRGQRESTWKLESSLTRIIEKNNNNNMKDCEKYSIKKFKSSAHLYDPNFFHHRDSDLSLLAYAQHHGCPTKLLDFTNSKFLALFFAFDNMDLEGESKYVRIWFFENGKLNKKTVKLLKKNYAINITKKKLATESEKNYKRYVKEKKEYDCLFFLEPDLESHKIHIQQGGFICSGDITKSIKTIYESHYTHIINYVDIDKKLYKDVFDYLFSMNISHKTIYGGVEGFAKDIANEFLNVKKIIINI